LDLYKDLHGGPPPRADLVLNQCEAGQAGSMGAAFRQVFRVPQDPEVAEFDTTGGSLLKLSAASPAVAALAAWEVRG
jgi:hypothetical protein